VSHDAFRTGYLPEPDGLRALAVAAVLMHHCLPAWFVRLHGGEAGVRLFFVLSGFLITGILLRGRPTPGAALGAFYARRFLRIFPRYYAILLLSLGLPGMREALHGTLPYIAVSRSLPPVHAPPAAQGGVPAVAGGAGGPHSLSFGGAEERPVSAAGGASGTIHSPVLARHQFRPRPYSRRNLIASPTNYSLASRVNLHHPQLTREMPITTQPDKRFLIVVFVFGIVAACVGIHWLRAGAIVIRGGESRTGVGETLPPPAPQRGAPVAGSIGHNSVLYYPLCVAWVGLGVSMVALSVLSFLSSNDLLLRLYAFSCLAILLLVEGTVAAAIWSGP
jgi:hypothetical protein